MGCDMRTVVISVGVILGLIQCYLVYTYYLCQEAQDIAKKSAWQKKQPAQTNPIFIPKNTVATANQNDNNANNDIHEKAYDNDGNLPQINTKKELACNLCTPPEKSAFATYLGTDSYIDGVFVVGESLQAAGSLRPLVVLVSPTVSESTRSLLHDMSNVKIVDYPDSAPTLDVFFRKLHFWSMIEYEKVVYLDGDLLIRTNVDELFCMPELSAASDCCPPSEFNSGVMVLKPNMETYNDLLKMKDILKSSDGKDQGFLNEYFYNVWNNIPYSYNVLSGTFEFHSRFRLRMMDHPDYAKIYHYTVPKPWHIYSVYTWWLNEGHYNVFNEWLAHWKKMPTERVQKSLRLLEDLRENEFGLLGGFDKFQGMGGVDTWQLDPPIKLKVWTMKQGPHSVSQSLTVNSGEYELTTKAWLMEYCRPMEIELEVTEGNNKLVSDRRPIKSYGPICFVANKDCEKYAESARFKIAKDNTKITVKVTMSAHCGGYDMGNLHSIKLVKV